MHSPPIAVRASSRAGLWAAVRSLMAGLALACLLGSVGQHLRSLFPVAGGVPAWAIWPAAGLAGALLCRWVWRHLGRAPIHLLGWDGTSWSLQVPSLAGSGCAVAEVVCLADWGERMLVRCQPARPGVRTEWLAFSLPAAATEADRKAWHHWRATLLGASAKWGSA